MKIRLVLTDEKPTSPNYPVVKVYIGSDGEKQVVRFIEPGIGQLIYYESNKILPNMTVGSANYCEWMFRPLKPGEQVIFEAGEEEKAESV